MSVLDCQRSLFSIPSEVKYFNCGYMAPKMKKVIKAGQAALKSQESPWKFKPEDFWNPVELARGLFADLIGAAPEQIAVIPSVSYGLATAAKSVSIQFGKEILLLKDQFPSNVYVWRNLAKQRSLRIVTVDREPGKTLTEAVLENIHEQTSLVCIPQVRWCDGAYVDLEKVSEKVGSVGASLVVDGIQSVGVYPFDVKRIKPAFMAVSCYKWLLGPYSLGFLYVADRYLDSEPLEFNWLNRQGSGDFPNLLSYQEIYQEGARRFDMGEKSQFLHMPMCLEALGQIKEWGVSNISQTISILSSKLRSGALELGYEVLPEEESVPHMLGISSGKRGFSEDIGKKLKKSNIYVSFRGNSMRVTPHIYNSLAEIDTFLQVLGDRKKQK